MVNNPNFDIYIDEGADFSIFLELSNVSTDSLGVATEVPVDLTGITNVYAKVKRDFANTAPTILTFTASITNATGGEINLALTKVQTANLYSGTLSAYHIGYYDVVIQNSLGTVSKLVSGKVFVNQSISI